MSFTVQAEAPLLREDSDGALRVGESHVLLLELIIRAFQDGATPESIVQRYSTLALPDVYSVITYFLRHRQKIESYLVRREEQAKEIERRAAGHPAQREIRDRILSNRQN